MDKVEQLAIDRVKELFGVEYANVQPHSGSQANAAVYLAVLKPGEKILGFNLAHGGHLTHGSPVNFSGKIYQPAILSKKKTDLSTTMRWNKQLWKKSLNSLSVVHRLTLEILTMLVLELFTKLGFTNG